MEEEHLRESQGSRPVLTSGRIELAHAGKLFMNHLLDDIRELVLRTGVEVSRRSYIAVPVPTGMAIYRY